MGQVTIYLDSRTEDKLKMAVEKTGISKSKWISEIIQEKTSCTWPEHVKRLAGTWSDMPTAEEIRNSAGIDADREALP